MVAEILDGELSRRYGQSRSRRWSSIWRRSGRRSHPHPVGRHHLHHVALDRPHQVGCPSQDSDLVRFTGRRRAGNSLASSLSSSCELPLECFREGQKTREDCLLGADGGESRYSGESASVPVLPHGVQGGLSLLSHGPNSEPVPHRTHAFTSIVGARADHFRLDGPLTQPLTPAWPAPSRRRRAQPSPRAPAASGRVARRGERAQG